MIHRRNTRFELFVFPLPWMAQKDRVHYGEFLCKYTSETESQCLVSDNKSCRVSVCGFLLVFAEDDLAHVLDVSTLNCNSISTTVHCAEPYKI